MSALLSPCSPLKCQRASRGDGMGGGRIAMGTAIYRSLHTPEPQKSQKVSKSSSGPPARSVKNLEGPEKESKGEGREERFETFWGSRGLGLWRLLYMAAPITMVGVCPDSGPRRGHASNSSTCEGSKPDRQKSQEYCFRGRHGGVEKKRGGGEPHE